VEFTTELSFSIEVDAQSEDEALQLAESELSAMSSDALPELWPDMFVHASTQTVGTRMSRVRDSRGTEWSVADRRVNSPIAEWPGTYQPDRRVKP
jgi:hypothetical protein